MRRVGDRVEARELTPCRVDGCANPAFSGEVYANPAEGDCFAHAKDRLWPIEEARREQATRDFYARPRVEVEAMLGRPLYPAEGAGGGGGTPQPR